MQPNTNIPLVALLSPMHLRNLPVRSEQFLISSHREHAGLARVAVGLPARSNDEIKR